MWQNAANSSELRRPGWEGSLWFCWYCMAGGKFFSGLCSLEQPRWSWQAFMMERGRVRKTNTGICRIKTSTVICRIAPLPTRFPFLAWILTPTSSLLEGPLWATDLPLHVEAEWLQSDKEPWVCKLQNLQLLFFFSPLKPQVWEYCDNSKNHVDKLLYFGRNSRTFKKHMKNWWGGILLCSEIALHLWSLLKNHFWLECWQRSSGPSSSFSFALMSTVMLPSKGLPSCWWQGKMSCRILENICAFLHSNFQNSCAALLHKCCSADSLDQGLMYRQRQFWEMYAFNVWSADIHPAGVQSPLGIWDCSSSMLHINVR